MSSYRPVKSDVYPVFACEDSPWRDFPACFCLRNMLACWFLVPPWKCGSKWANCLTNLNSPEFNSGVRENKRLNRHSQKHLRLFSESPRLVWVNNWGLLSHRDLLSKKIMDGKYVKMGVQRENIGIHSLLMYMCGLFLIFKKLWMRVEEEGNKYNNNGL